MRRRRCLGPVGDDLRQIGGTGQQVLREGPRHQVAALVVYGLLEQRLGDALDDAPVHLALDDEWVDHLAHVVDARVLADLDPTGLGVDLGHAQVGAVRERERRRVEGRLRVQLRLDPVGQVVRGEDGD